MSGLSRHFLAQIVLHIGILLAWCLRGYALRLASSCQQLIGARPWPLRRGKKAAASPVAISPCALRRAKSHQLKEKMKLGSGYRAGRVARHGCKLPVRPGGIAWRNLMEIAMSSRADSQRRQRGAHGLGISTSGSVVRAGLGSIALGGTSCECLAWTGARNDNTNEVWMPLLVSPKLQSNELFASLPELLTICRWFGASVALATLAGAWAASCRRFCGSFDRGSREATPMTSARRRRRATRTAMQLERPF